jgi:tRNA(Ile)-lysidine synthetase-like protein
MKIQKNKNELINLVNKTHIKITKQDLIRPTQLILITVSGGQDSICLFFILLQLKKQWNWGFGILYCNHFWQIDSFYTSSLIFKLGFLFLIPAYLSLPSENIFSEQKSRNWRYGHFKRLSYFYNYDMVVTGHTASDRIETILLQLIRGTSTRGLATLNWFRPFSTQRSKMSRPRPHSSSLTPYSEQTILKACSNGSESSTYKMPFDYHKRLQAKHTTLRTNLLTKGVKLSNLFDETRLSNLSSSVAPIALAMARGVGNPGTDLSIFASAFWDEGKSNKVPLSDLESQISLRSFTFRDFNCVRRQHQKSMKFCFSPLVLKQDTKSESTKVFNKKKNDSSVNNGVFIEDFCTQVVFKLQNQFLSFDLYKKKNLLKDQKFLSVTQRVTQSSPLRGNSVALQRKKINFFYIHAIWIYDDFLFLTFEKWRIVNKLHKFNYRSPHCPCNGKGGREPGFICQQIFVTCLSVIQRFTQNSPLRGNPFYFDRFQVLSTYELTLSTIVFNSPNWYSYTNNLIFLSPRQRQKLPSSESYRSLSVPLRVTQSLALRAKPPRLKFNKQNLFAVAPIALAMARGVGNPGKNIKIRTEVCLPEVSTKFFRSKTKFKNRLRSVTSWKSSYVSRQRGKFSYFKFKPLILNTKSCKIFIKFFKVSYWVEFKQKFSEFKFFEGMRSIASHTLVCEGKSILNFENSQHLTKSYFSLSNSQQFQIKILIYKNFSSGVARVGNPGNKYFNPILDVSKKNTLVKDEIFDLVFVSAKGQGVNQNRNLKFLTSNENLFSLRKIRNNKFLVFRPLLFINRFDLKQLCNFLELPLYPDQTNDKLTYYRNRVRKQLLPLLRFFFNPQIDKLFLQFAEIANTEQLYLDSISTRLQQEFNIEKNKTFEFNLSLLHFIPVAIQRRLLKQFLDKYLTKKIKFFHIEILLNLIIKKRKGT